MTNLNFRNRLKEGVVLFDGGMGSELYKRGVFINKRFEDTNLTFPDLVKQIHQDYVDAGCDVIETNTYGANRFKLAASQLQDKLYEINYSGAKLAKEVAGDKVFVAGSVGPLGVMIEPLGAISFDEAKAYFKEQLQALFDGGVDLFVFETFIYINELKAAIAAAGEICDLPVVANITIDEDCSSLTGASVETQIEELSNLNTEAIGVNCTVGPQIMLTWLEKARKLTDLNISLMPNAGKPKNIEGRNIYLTSPEYIGEYAKHFINAGANIIGGCCGTGPDHIRKMRNMIAAVKPELKRIKIDFKKPDVSSDIGKISQENKSRLAQRIKDKKFVTLVELVSPHGVDPKKEIDKAREMFYYGIDAINIPDGPRASARMSALALAILIQQNVGIETILHYVCRDRNVIGIQSDLLGAYALGVRNVLALTGDPPKLGNYPDATAVFDIDSIGLVNVLERLNRGLDIAGNKIGSPTGFFSGVGANPGAVNFDEEMRRLEWKIKAGAEYIITQPVFDLDIFNKFVDSASVFGIPIIAGLWPLTSIRNAEFMNNEIPGCDVPKSVLERLAKYSDSKEDGIKEGIDIARETLHTILKQISGVQISAPFGRVQSVKEILNDFHI